MERKRKFVYNKKEHEDCLKEFKDIILFLASKYEFFPYKHIRRNIRNIDLSLIYWFMKKYRPDGFFESGILWSRSTCVIAESMKRLKLDIPYYIAATCKHQSLTILVKKYPNIIMKHTTGQNLAPEVKKFNNLGVLIDGPKWKYEKKMRLIYYHLMKKNKIAFAFHHDISGGSRRNKDGFRKFYHRNSYYFDSWYPNKIIDKKMKMYIDKENKPVLSAAYINREIID